MFVLSSLAGRLHRTFRGSGCPLCLLYKGSSSNMTSSTPGFWLGLVAILLTNNYIDMATSCTIKCPCRPLLVRYTRLNRSCFPLASTASLSVVGCKCHIPLRTVQVQETLSDRVPRTQEAIRAFLNSKAAELFIADIGSCTTQHQLSD